MPKGRWSWRALFGGLKPPTSRPRSKRPTLQCEPLESRLALDAGLVISEFLASNDNSFRDADHQRPDWVEILNTSSVEHNLDGWYLTDDANDLTKWQFPEALLQPGERRVVFASGKDRAVPGAELHTNFRLSVRGEYLGLVEPDGTSVAFDFGTRYPPQIPDVSYGIPQPVEELVLHAPGDTARMLVPRDGTVGTDWTTAGFDDSLWSSVETGVGYGSSFGSVFTTDVQASLKGVGTTAYLRLPFELSDAENVSSLEVTVQYNDGFVAYLNGTEVARRNAPENVTWNSKAPARRGSSESLQAETFDLSPYVRQLTNGKNVLAIQGLNSNARSSRFLLVPELRGRSAGSLELQRRTYFVMPTANDANGIGTTTLIDQVDHSPQVPAEGEDLAVTARIASTVGEVVPIELHYRVMFGDETSAAMFDDGQHGDGAAGDGVYGATIPGGIATAGQMLRYRITAGTVPENAFRAPVFIDPTNRQQYFGTVIVDPSIDSQLPVFHLFLEDPDAANTSEGTHGALFHDGQFYDNIVIDASGRTVGRSGPKKSHDIFFPKDHDFLLAGETVPMDSFTLITDYFNRARVRIPLAFEAFREIGTPAHLSLSVRFQQNGEFFGTYFFVDGGNGRILERAGLDPRGAFYKMGNSFSFGELTKKATRRWEDYTDVQDLFRGLSLSGADRVNYLMDNVNIPAVVNYLVGLVIADQGDCCSRNLYVYRDTEGNGEWQALPWDLDGSLGRGGVRDPRLYPWQSAPELAGRGNLFFSSLFQGVPGFVDMYMRRLRTVADEVLKPPGTPADQLWFEQKIDGMVQQLAGDVALDFAKWGTFDPPSTWEEQLGILRDEYFPRRRVFLYGLLGDMDLNGRVDTSDVDDFVLGLTDPVAYRARYEVDASLRGDTDSDAALDLDFDDIARFVRLVQGGPQPVLPMPAAQVDTPRIEFGLIESAPASGNQDEEFIELVNPNDVAVDISGWRLAGGVRHTFASGVVIPAGTSLYVSPNVNVFRARQTGPTGGQGLFIQGNYRGHVSNEGETIRLVTPDGSLVQEITTLPQSTPA
ncbi:MAG: lamin tail domain-containing protein [Pirellulales bacterium]